MENLQDVKIQIILLNIGYDSIIQASLNVTEEDLLSLHDDELIRIQLSQNPLKNFIFALADLLETDSQESQELDTEKRKQTVIVFPVPVPESESSSFKLSYANPTSYETPNNKRKVSETSFGTRSTEITPNKLVHSEAKVQALQNVFVYTMINEVWLGIIGISWVKGRKMFLTYTELIFLETSLMVEQRRPRFNIHFGPLQIKL